MKFEDNVKKCFEVVDSSTEYPTTGEMSLFFYLEGFKAPLNLRDLVGLNGMPDILGATKLLRWRKAKVFPGVVVTNSNVLFIKEVEKEEEKCEEETN